MRIEDYPHIKNGPPCGCAHRRLNHVGPMQHMRRTRVPDVGCQLCDCAEYQPVDANLSEMRREEFPLEIELREAEYAAARRRNMGVQVFLAVTTLLALGYLFLSDGDMRVFVGLLMLGVMVNTLNSAYAAYRNGDLEHTVVWLAGATVVATPVLQLLFNFPWAVGLSYVAIATVAAMAYLLWDGVQMKRDIRNWETEMAERPSGS